MVSEIKSKLGIKISPRAIIGSAQLAFIVVILIHQFDLPVAAFIQGVLLGYSMVGNLYGLVIWRKER